MKTPQVSENVHDQYRNSDNLQFRIAFQKKYSVNPQGFVNWIFSVVPFPISGEILELGCGSGEMWRENLALLLPDCRLLLTDLSENMVATAKETLGAQPNLVFDTADIQNLPYETGRFAMVMAHMMLYHVPDLHRGLAEVRRVLSSDGCFCCATYGEDGIVPFLSHLLLTGHAAAVKNQKFTLQNGEEILRKHFSQVAQLDYPDAFAVTNLEDVLRYMDTLKGMSPLYDADHRQALAKLTQAAKGGVLTIPKEYGLFICRP